MTQNPSGGSGGSAPLFQPDEPQPSSAINDLHAASEREDGVNRGAVGAGGEGPGAAEGIPELQLTPEEHQPIDAAAERAALSEREDGTNRG